MGAEEVRVALDPFELEKLSAQIEGIVAMLGYCENCGKQRDEHLDKGLYFKCLFEPTEFKLKRRWP